VIRSLVSAIERERAAVDSLTVNVKAISGSAAALVAAAFLSGHALGASAASPSRSFGFAGSSAATPAAAQAHLAQLRAIESYRDPRTTYALRRVPCDGAALPTTSCFVAASR